VGGGDAESTVSLEECISLLFAVKCISFANHCILCSFLLFKRIL
jgi:hypothetical protein